MILRFSIILVLFVFNSPSVFSQKKLIDSLNAVINRQLKDTSSINALCDLSKEYLGTDNAKALNYAKEALVLSKTIGQQKFIAQSYLRIGGVYDYKMMSDSCLFFYFEALKIYEAINDKSGIASGYQNIGVAYYFQNDFDKATEYYNKALEIRLKLKDWKFVSKLYNNLGVIYRRQKKYEKAIDIYRRSLELKKSINDEKGISAVYMNIGLVHSYKGDYDSAIFYGQKSLEIDNKRGDTHDIASTHLAIGQIMVDFQKANEAKPYLYKGIELAKKVEANDLLYNGYALLSMADTLLKDYKSAYYHTKQFEEYQNKVINEEKTVEVEKLQVLYESEKKDASIKTLKIEQESKNREQKILYSAIAVVSLLLGVSLMLYIGKRKANIVLQKQKQEIIDKTEILQRQAAEIAMFKTQINPHFIFNAINSAQNFIVNDNKQLALENLSDLSKLIRTTLNYSDRETITLEEEKEFLHEYFKFEKQRKNYPITLSVSCADDIDVSNVLIPPMLIQPFIENASKHAFGKEIISAQITVRFEKDNQNNLRIEIKDNGIGIFSSQQNKKQKNHQSRGIDITVNRIKNLWEKQNNNFFEYYVAEEIKNNEKTLGTCIIIVLPYIEQY